MSYEEAFGQAALGQAPTATVLGVSMQEQLGTAALSWTGLFMKWYLDISFSIFYILFYFFFYIYFIVKLISIFWIIFKYSVSQNSVSLTFADDLLVFFPLTVPHEIS